MAKDVSIVFEYEPLCKVICTCFDCKHNLTWQEMASCNLKWVQIDEEGRCASMEKRGQK